LGPERRLAYEETIRIPLLVRYPKRFPPRSRPDNFVLSVDIAATALALAGVTSPKPFHGRPLWAKPQRDAVLIEYFDDTVFPRIRNMGYSAVRTRRWKYIHYRSLRGADEMYDLKSDPYELANRIGDPRAPLAELKRRLNGLLTETGDARQVS
jgi:arylsulfatase A-like enzyme